MAGLEDELETLQSVHGRQGEQRVGMLYQRVLRNAATAVTIVTFCAHDVKETALVLRYAVLQRTCKSQAATTTWMTLTA